MTTRYYYVNSQNTIILFEDIDFWPKINLILYPLKTRQPYYHIGDISHTSQVVPPPLSDQRPTDPLLAAVANNSPMISLNKCGHNNV